MTDLTRLWHFNRPQLAASLVDRVLAHERVALFGPRQTGKTSLAAAQATSLCVGVLAGLTRPRCKLVTRFSI